MNECHAPFVLVWETDQSASALYERLRPFIGHYNGRSWRSHHPMTLALADCRIGGDGMKTTVYCCFAKHLTDYWMLGTERPPERVGKDFDEVIPADARPDHGKLGVFITVAKPLA